MLDNEVVKKQTANGIMQTNSGESEETVLGLNNMWKNKNIFSQH